MFHFVPFGFVDFVYVGVVCVGVVIVDVSLPHQILNRIVSLDIVSSTTASASVLRLFGVVGILVCVFTLASDWIEFGLGFRAGGSFDGMILPLPTLQLSPHHTLPPHLILSKIVLINIVGIHANFVKLVFFVFEVIVSHTLQIMLILNN